MALYICVPEAHRSAEPLAALRRYADARDWVVAAEVADHVPLDAPVTTRDGWRHVRHLILTRQAGGVVTELATMCGHTDAEQRIVHGWLAEHAAFLAVVLTPEAAR